MSTPPQPDPLAAIAALVVKDGVGLGGLADEARLQALGFVWAGLPRTALSERQVNEALKAQLTGAARCLDTDHVELRRWLCDTGWLARDGYGREYRRVASPDLPERLRTLGPLLEATFDGGDTAAYTERLRARRQAEREARRRAHLAAAGSAT
jgi:hypothetical protein